MLSNADSLFAKPSRATQAKVKRLETELQRKDSIIAAVTEEALELKKNFRHEALQAFKSWRQD